MEKVLFIHQSVHSELVFNKASKSVFIETSINVSLVLQTLAHKATLPSTTGDEIITYLALQCSELFIINSPVLHDP